MQNVTPRNAKKTTTSLASSSLGVPLPAQAISSLADLVAAGWGIQQALQALPRKSLPLLLRREIESALAALRAGAPLDVLLSRLGLEITAVTLRGAQTQASTLETALRADAEARAATDEVLRKTRMRVQFFGGVLGVLVALVAYVSFSLVPNIIRDLSATLPGGWELPQALARFEHFRNLWLLLGASCLLTGVALVLIYAGWLGRDGWKPFLQDLRLHLPFLRGHAIHSSSARLLEALVHEQLIGIPANETLRRVRQREPVPRLQEALDLAADRLDTGDPWSTCLRGTLLDTPTLADLASLASRGAQPTQGWRWAAKQHRDQAIRQLRRAMFSAAVVVLVPTLLFLGVLLHTAAVTVTIAQVEGVSQQIEMLTQEVESMLDSEPGAEP